MLSACLCCSGEVESESIIGRELSQAPRDVENLFMPTPTQAAAARAAAAQQEKLAKALASVPASEREPSRLSVDTSVWEVYGGLAIDALLEHTPCVDIAYLINLGDRGGIVPRLQDMPQAALITPAEAWRLRQWPFIDSLAVLVLSYPWLDPVHPDRNGTQLQSWLPVFKLMLRAARQRSPHGTVGVVLDYICLPQKPFADEAEKERFDTSLRAINEWYFHPYTIVLLVTTLPAGDENLAQYANTRLHEERGWCNFELNACLTIKNDQCLWDMRQLTRGITSYGVHGAPAPHGSLVATLKAGRAPPLSPDAFAAQLLAGVGDGSLKFTSNADVEVVTEQYRRGFSVAWDTFRARTLSAQPVWLEHLGWGDADALVLLDTLSHAAHACDFPDGPIIIYCLDGNDFSDGLRASIAAANAGKFHGKFVCKSGRNLFLDFPDA